MMDNGMRVCPFNKAHIVKNTRFTTHVVKCQLQNPHIKLNFCLFNGNHIIKPEDTMEHFESCPDRIPHSEVFRMFELRRHNQKLLEENKSDHPECSFEPIKDDDWSDVESDISSYKSYRSGGSRRYSTPSEVASSVASIRNYLTEIKKNDDAGGKSTPVLANARRLIRENSELPHWTPQGSQYEASVTGSNSRYESAFSVYSRLDTSELVSQAGTATDDRSVVD